MTEALACRIVPAGVCCLTQSGGCYGHKAACRALRSDIQHERRKSGGACIVGFAGSCWYDTVAAMVLRDRPVDRPAGVQLTPPPSSTTLPFLGCGLSLLERSQYRPFFVLSRLATDVSDPWNSLPGSGDYLLLLSPSPHRSAPFF